jgi:hypothetical protein
MEICNNKPRVLIFTSCGVLNHTIKELVELFGPSYEVVSSTERDIIMNATPTSGKCAVVTDMGFYVGNVKEQSEFASDFLAEIKEKNSACKVVLFSVSDVFNLNNHSFDYRISGGEGDDIRQLEEILSKYLS